MGECFLLEDLTEPAFHRDLPESAFDDHLFAAEQQCKFHVLGCVGVSSAYADAGNRRKARDVLEAACQIGDCVSLQSQESNCDSLEMFYEMELFPEPVTNRARDLRAWVCKHTSSPGVAAQCK